jgi:hypothetical protein
LIKKPKLEPLISQRGAAVTKARTKAFLTADDADIADRGMKEPDHLRHLRNPR